MTVSSMDKQGNFSGTGYYDGDRGYTWTVKGKAIGNRVKFKMVYTGKNKGYTSTNSGNIRPDGRHDGYYQNGGSFSQNNAIVSCLWKRALRSTDVYRISRMIEGNCI